MSDEIIQWPQIVISNMPKRFLREDFEKFLKDKNLLYRKIKVVPQKTFTFVKKKITSFFKTSF